MKKNLHYYLLIILLGVISLVLSILLINKSNQISNYKIELEAKTDKINNLESEIEKLKKMREDFEGSINRLNNLKEYNFKRRNDNITKDINSLTATVVYRKTGCSYFILENNQGYIVAEWYGGTDPDIGETLVGQFNSFGFKDYVTTNNSNCHLWIDDYMLSKESALEKINDKCD